MPRLAGGGQRVTQTTTGSSQPWAEARPYITTGLKGAEDLLKQESGFNPYQGQLVAGFSPQAEAAMQGIEGLAGTPNPLLTGAQNSITGMLGQDQITTGGAYQGLFDQAGQPGALSGYLSGPGNTTADWRGLYEQAGQPGAASQYLTDYASGANVTGGSPEFRVALDYQGGRLADDINRGFSASGRYGSGAHAGVLGQELGNFRNQALASEIAREQALQMQAVGQLSAEQQNQLANRAGILSSLSNYGLQGAGMLSGEEQNRFGNQLGALGALSNVQGQNAGYQLNAAGMAPSLYAAQYAPYEALGQVGAMRDAREQARLEGEAARWEQGQNADWNRLNAYTGAISPFTGLGATSTQTTTEPRRPLATFMGALSTGAGILGSLAPFLLSDERAKTDVERVGETDEGVPIYTYHYKMGGPKMMGVLAQELAKTQPEAVHKGPRGLLAVDYGMVR